MAARPLPVLLLAAGLLLAPSAPLVAADPFEDAARREITAGEALRVAAFLAGPRFLGRGTGQKGNGDAALWLAGELARAGVSPGPAEASGRDGKPLPADYLQPFEVPAGKVGAGDDPRTANVIGLLEGTGRAGGTATEEGTPAGAEGAAPAPRGDPESVVLGAHFDHLGVHVDPPEPGRAPRKPAVFWGADDNASGTAAVLLAARTLARAARGGARTRRTVVFAFFSAEEIGLLGSKHYVEAPVRPLAGTVCMVNLDMVGRNGTKYLEVYGNTTSPEVDGWNRAALEATGMEAVYPPPALYGRSDQWSFYEAGIPALFLHGGLHPDYHTVRDVPADLNGPKIALVARQALEVLRAAADDSRRPSFRRIDTTGAGGRLGIAVEPCTPLEMEALQPAEGTAAVRVAAVFSGGLAERLLRPGDVIHSWNGSPLRADDPVERFRAFERGAREGETVVLRYLRGKERMAASVKF